MKYGLTLTETLLQEAGYSNSTLYENSWEVGRLVLDPNYRSGQDLLKKCLYSTLSYLYENTEIQDFFASCTHILSRLYRRFGFSIIKKDILLPRTEKNYTLIRGSACEIFNALAIEKH
jgi:predicted GNAT family N-acyltransferase